MLTFCTFLSFECMQVDSVLHYACFICRRQGKVCYELLAYSIFLFFNDFSFLSYIFLSK